MAPQGSETPSNDDAVHDTRRDWHALLLLLVLVLPLRAWLVFNTEVAARDSIGFIRYALEFEKHSWQETLLKNHQHPGYALTVWAVSQPVRAVAGTTPLTMRLSAQLASCLAALALLVPMYFLGKQMFDRRIGFWAALLFQYLPVSGHHLADGVSEALFLFLVAMALWRGVVAVRQYRPAAFAWSGIFGGLAYLTRPEGALVVLAVGLVLVGMQLVRAWRKPWLSFLKCGTSLSLAAAAVGSVYVLTTGMLTNKIAARRIGTFIQQTQVEAVRQPLTASVFGAFFKRTEHLPARVGRSLQAMGAEFTQGLHYLGLVPAFLGLLWTFRALRSRPEFWVPAGYCLIHGAILLLLAMVEFYVSDRHMMVLVLCATYFIVAGVLGICARLAMARLPTRLPAYLMIALLLFCLPKTAQRLHGNRAGNHAAGLWLARHVAVGDDVDDDHAYSHYYAGQVFEEGKNPVLPKDYQPTCYVVMTRSRAAEIAAERMLKEKELQAKGKAVYHWPEDRGLEEARVVIYSQPRDWEKRRWTKEP